MIGLYYSVEQTWTIISGTILKAKHKLSSWTEDKDLGKTTEWYQIEQGFPVTSGNTSLYLKR